MEELKAFLFTDLFEVEGFCLAPIHLLIFTLLFLGGKILILYLRRFFKSQHLDNKKFTIEGKEIPIWRLTRQLIWLFIFFLGVRSLSIGNHGLDLSRLLAIEFFRFDKFHVAIYHIFILLMVYFGGRITFSLIRMYLLQRIKRTNKLDQGTEYVYFQLIKYVLISIAVIIILRSMGVNLGQFLQAMIFLSLAVALGLQDIFRDFFAGFLLLFEGSVKVGDIVEIEQTNSNPENLIAKILEINMRTSRVETRDGKMLIVPNSNLTSFKVNNWSAGDQIVRFMISVEVKYGSDLDLVKKIMIECASNHPKVVNTKDVIVRLLDFGNNGYKLDLVFWGNKNFFIEIHKSDIRFAIDKEFKKHGIVYPFSQLDVHIVEQKKNVDSLEADAQD
jgi:small-conductance mechanosensitive channel